MSAPYPSLAIANDFIRQFGGNDGIEHMKLQKLMYFSYGWWLAEKGLSSVRLTHDKPQIWQYGPVFHDLYHVLKVFGLRPISEMQSASPFKSPDTINDDDTETKGMIEWVWKRYGHLTSFALSELTHEPGTSWHRIATEKNFLVDPNTPIPDKYILDEFSSLMNSPYASNTTYANSEVAAA